MSDKNRIGKKVRLIRESRKLSIDDVSERTNLSAAGIESIEKLKKIYMGTQSEYFKRTTDVKMYFLVLD